MRTFLAVVSLSLLLTGCARAAAPPAPVPTERPDLSVSTEGIEATAIAALGTYVDTTNAIVAGEASPESVADVTSSTWATEELAGFAALDALDSGPQPTISVSKAEVARVRGTVAVVDVLLHVCFDGGGNLTLATLRLVPRDGVLVVDHIRPWEDSTWCEPEPSFSF